MLPTPGEDRHRVGELGTREAKLWLDSTTRVRYSYTNMDDGGPNRLAFWWPHGGQPYSYDLGGVFRGKPFENESFAAESKKYANANDQGTHFDKFLAQTYCTILSNSRLVQHFMWITWAPFRVNTWNKLHSEESVLKALEIHRDKVFGTDEIRNVSEMIDDEVLQRLMDTMWIIVLSDKQTALVISTDDRIELNKIRDKREFGNDN